MGITEAQATIAPQKNISADLLKPSVAHHRLALISIKIFNLK